MTEQLFNKRCSGYLVATLDLRNRRRAEESEGLSPQKVMWESCTHCALRVYDTVGRGEFITIPHSTEPDCENLQTKINEVAKVSTSCAMRRILVQLALIDRSRHACPLNGCNLVVDGETRVIENTNNTACSNINYNQTDFSGCSHSDPGMCTLTNFCIAAMWLRDQAPDNDSFPGVGSYTESILGTNIEAAYNNGCTYFPSKKGDF